jgi:hypothetical protein
VLLFPVVHFTTNVTIIRTYLVALGALGMYLGFRPWLRLGYSRAVPAAAFLLSVLWTTSFFGALAQPNFFVTVAALAVVGYAVLALRAPKNRRYLLAVAGWTALMALLRPSDATWLAIPMVLALFAVRSIPVRRRLVAGGTVLVGLALGWSEWVVEAYVSYGGFFQRLHDANAENTPGLHFSLLAEARDINGPVLCRPCSGVPLTVAHFAWWFALPPLIAIGLFSVRRSRRFLPLALATLGGTTVLLEYCLTISYAAPRFLLPAYALLALPSAAGIAALLRWRPKTTWHLAVVAVVACLLLAQAADQARVLRHAVHEATRNRDRFTNAANVLRTQGVRAPCIIYGHFGPPVAFALGCNDLPVGPVAVARTSTGTTVAALTPKVDHGAFPGWQVVHLKADSRWVAHILRPLGAAAP